MNNVPRVIIFSISALAGNTVWITLLVCACHVKFQFWQQSLLQVTEGVAAVVSATISVAMANDTFPMNITSDIKHETLLDTYEKEK